MANGQPIKIRLGSNNDLANLLTNIEDDEELAQKSLQLSLHASDASLAVLTPSNLALMSDAFQRGGPVKLIGLSLDLCIFYCPGAPSPQDVGAFIGETATLQDLRLQDPKPTLPPSTVEPNAIVNYATGLLNAIKVGPNLKDLRIQIGFYGNAGDFQAFASALERQSRLETLGFDGSRLSTLGFDGSRLAKNKNMQENMEPIAAAISRMQGLRKLRVGTRIRLSHWEKHLPEICKQLIALQIVVDRLGLIYFPNPRVYDGRILVSFLNILKTNTSIKTLQISGPRYSTVREKICTMPLREKICTMLHDNCAIIELGEWHYFRRQKAEKDPTVNFYLHLNRAGRMKHLAALAGVDATTKDLLHSYLALDQVGAPPRLKASLLYQLLKVQPSTWCNSQASYQPNEEEPKPVGHVGKNEPVSHVGKNKDGSTVQWEQPKAGKTVKVLGKIEDGPASGHGKGKCTKKAKLALNRSSNRYAVLAGDSDSESD